MTRGLIIIYIVSSITSIASQNDADQPVQGAGWQGRCLVAMTVPSSLEGDE